MKIKGYTTKKKKLSIEAHRKNTPQENEYIRIEGNILMLLDSDRSQSELIHQLTKYVIKERKGV